MVGQGMDPRSRERTNLDRLGMTDAETRTLLDLIDGTTLDMAGMSTWMTALSACSRV
jgi:hypothetical protein